MRDWTIYDKARRHGLDHFGAMLALDRGKVECWCGNVRVCDGGAQRFVGCLTHGVLPAPEPEQLLEPDPDVYLAGGPLHETCEGGCEGVCECEK